MTKHTLTIDGKDAINLSDIPAGGQAKSIKLAAGQYAATLESNVHFHNQIFKLDQALLFNTAPLKNNDSERWYYTLTTTQGTVITAVEGQPIYLYLVDQVTSSDNTGSATVTFTKL